MYNEYFGFKEAPFSIAPDPRYLYLTDQHREALAHLSYGFNSDGGCILLTGEVGTGKTTACRCLLEQLPNHVNIALVLNPKVSAIELLEIICDELKIDYPANNTSIKTYIDCINSFLIETNARNEKTVLIIDEAQNLDSTVLEQLRLLTNLETNKRKLLQIIILGQPELLEILSRKELRQLAQRITARFHLKPLSSHDVKAYITHRLAVAGQNVQLFPEPVIKKLYRLSQGIPRLINVLCDRALLGTYVQNKSAVDMTTLETAAKEVFGELKIKSGTGNRLKKFILPFTTTIAASLVLAVIVFFALTPENNSTASVPVESTTATEKDPPISKQNIKLENTGMQSTAQIMAQQMDYAIDTLGTTDTTDTLTIENSALTTNTTRKSITDFINDVKHDNKSQAYAALFRTWKRDYNTNNNANACEFAHTQGLSCLHRQGNLNSLRKINRPAILQLYKEDGNPVHVIVTRLDAAEATIDTGTETFEIATSLLDTLWFGEYTVLWKKPPYYNKAVIPGSAGPVVQWLDQQLVRIFGHSGDAPTINDTYTDVLVSQVKKFQQSKGLIPDGVVGPVTCIYLNSELGSEVPSLKLKDS